MHAAIRGPPKLGYLVEMVNSDRSGTMTTAGSRTILLCGLLVGCCSTMGCVFSSDHRILRLWADYNTLKTPALFIEETDHLPYHMPRVKHYRWMYNANYGQPHVGMTVYPTGIVTPTGASHEPIETPVPAPELPLLSPQKTPSTELPPLPSKKPPNLDSTGGKPTQPVLPSKPKSIPIPLKRPVPDGPSAARNRLIRPAKF